MANVHDVAAYILSRQAPMSTWKLQKLVYYAQAWHLVWHERPLFKAEIQAWANGPVVPDLYAKHRGKFEVSKWSKWGSADVLTSTEATTTDAVLSSYGRLTGRQLVHMTHAEKPWIEARGDLGPTDRSVAEISRDSMLAFYAALDADPSATPVEDIDWSGF
jgi:uncharacterized phage-associated protein